MNGTCAADLQVTLADLERQRDELRHKLAQADEAKKREGQEAESRRKHELEQQRDAAVEDFNRAREVANQALIEPMKAMHEAELRWIAATKVLVGVGRYLPGVDFIQAGELQPFGEAVDTAYGLQRRLKEREQEAVSQRLTKEQDDRRIRALWRERDGTGRG